MRILFAKNNLNLCKFKRLTIIFLTKKITFTNLAIAQWSPSPPNLTTVPENESTERIKK